MALEDDIATLAGAPLFHLLERDALRLVAFAAETRALRAGDVLFRRGDRSDGGHVVARGAIALPPAGPRHWPIVPCRRGSLTPGLSACAKRL